jgi:hypothetical protein
VASRTPTRRPYAKAVLSPGSIPTYVPGTVLPPPSSYPYSAECLEGLFSEVCGSNLGRSGRAFRGWAGV